MRVLDPKLCSMSALNLMSTVGKGSRNIPKQAQNHIYHGPGKPSSMHTRVPVILGKGSSRDPVHGKQH